MCEIIYTVNHLSLSFAQEIVDKDGQSKVLSFTIPSLSKPSLYHEVSPSNILLIMSASRCGRSNKRCLSDPSLSPLPLALWPWRKEPWPITAWVEWFTAAPTSRERRLQRRTGACHIKYLFCAQCFYFRHECLISKWALYSTSCDIYVGIASL